MNKRKQLFLSIAIVPILIVIYQLASITLPKSHYGGTNIIVIILLILLIGWICIGLAFMSGRYAKDLGIAEGLWQIFSIFFPIIVPCILVGFSRPPLPQLSADMNFNGKPLRDWELGEAQKIYNAWKYWGLGGDTLILAKNGLIGNRKALESGIKWNDISAIYQNLRDEYVNGIHTKKIRRYTLILKNGGRLVFNGRYNDIDELGQKLQIHVTEALQPSAIASLEKGELIQFGPFLITQNGIKVKGQELPWDKIGNIVLNSGYLVVTRVPENKIGYTIKRSMENVVGVVTRFAGTAQPMLGNVQAVQWKKIPAKNVPNLFLVILLSQAILQSKT
jgi:hypothetical protein